MSVKTDNDRRIKNGRRIFASYCDLLKLPPVERREEYTVTDLIVDLCHFARSKGWDTETILRSAADHLEAETIESCAKCGKPVTHEWATTDEGTGEEEGKTFYYCSDECRDRH
jgi:hypothetical protein